MKIYKFTVNSTEALHEWGVDKKVFIFLSYEKANEFKSSFVNMEQPQGYDVPILINKENTLFIYTDDEIEELELVDGLEIARFCYYE